MSVIAINFSRLGDIDTSLWYTLYYVAFFVLGIVLAHHGNGIKSWFECLRIGSKLVFALASFVMFTYFGMKVAFHS